jgi:alkylation response protein AidB-like acyl-CoA dehydrogenase
VAEKGWIGMTWPKAFGGGGHSYSDRYAVVEELLAAGAPVAAHWIADRQSGALLLRYGSDVQKGRYLGEIAAGRCFFAIGLSEPDAGSDLASVRTVAKHVPGGWLLNGTKVWTSHAHRSQFMIALVRTAPRQADRHLGLSQIIVDLGAKGVTVRPIALLSGALHFNEVVLQDAFMSDDMLLGQEGDGWRQVTSELAHERSGPERVLSTFPLLVELVRSIGSNPDALQSATVGRLIARLWALRSMSKDVAARLEAGDDPVVDAALVKDLGTRFEQIVVEYARVATDPTSASESFQRMYQASVSAAPGFTLRGGTTEILQGIVARAATTGRRRPHDETSRMISASADSVFGMERTDYMAEASSAGFLAADLDLWTAALVIEAASYHGVADNVCEAVMPEMDDAYQRIALLRAIQLSGAIQRTRDLSIQYTADRQQFGRPLREFQALQGHLAVICGEAAAASASVWDAVGAPSGGRIAAAKITTGTAAGVAAAIAHQVHGAIGITREYPLHRWTGRLWAWRDQGGREAEWASWLGRQICSSGAGQIWEITTSVDETYREARVG